MGQLVYHYTTENMNELERSLASLKQITGQVGLQVESS
jgi:hypothetical protein